MKHTISLCILKWTSAFHFSRSLLVIVWPFLQTLDVFKFLNKFVLLLMLILLIYFSKVIFNFHVLIFTHTHWQTQKHTYRQTHTHTHTHRDINLSRQFGNEVRCSKTNNWFSPKFSKFTDPAHAHTHTHTHTHTHPHTHTHLHTHTHTYPRDTDVYLEISTVGFGAFWTGLNWRVSKDLPGFELNFEVNYFAWTESWHQ